MLTQPRIVDHACTAISPMIDRTLGKVAGTRVLVLVSDVADTCTGISRPAELDADTRLIVLLLPSVGPIVQRGPEALVRAGDWHRQVPGSRVVLFHDLAPWRWKELARPASR